MSQLGFAQDNIFVGTLKDQKTKKPIKYASISINHSLYSVISNERGEFNIKYTDKNDTLCINCFGYLIKDIPIHSAKEEIYLKPVKTVLDEVVITALGPNAILCRALDSSDKYNWTKDFTCQTETFACLKTKDSISWLLYSRDLYKITKRFSYSRLVDFDNIYNRYVCLDSINKPYFASEILSFGAKYRMILNSKKIKKNIEQGKLYEVLDLEIIPTYDDRDSIYIVTGYSKRDEYANSKYYIDAKTFAFIQMEDFDKNYRGNTSIVIDSVFGVLTFKEYDNKYYPANYYLKYNYRSKQDKTQRFEEKYLMNVVDFIPKEKDKSRGQNDFILNEYLKNIKTDTITDIDKQRLILSEMLENKKIKSFISF